MKEAFKYYRPGLKKRAMVESADYVYQSLIKDDVTVTPIQLYWTMADSGLLDPEEVNEVKFAVDIYDGIYGGAIDWDITPNRPAPPVSHIGSRPVEVWLTSYSLLPWAQKQAEKHDVTVVTDWRQKFQLHSMYEAVNRLYPRATYRPHAILFISDDRNSHERCFNHMDELLRHMLVIRMARDEFNEQVGAELWTPQVLYLPEAPPGDKTAINTKRQIREIIRDSKIQLDGTLNTVNLTPQFVEAGLPSSHLHSMNARKLNDMFGYVVDEAHKQILKAESK